MDGVVLNADHLERPDSRGIGQVVDSEGQADKINQLYQPACVKFAGTRLLLVLLHNLCALGLINGRRFDHRILFHVSQWRGTPFS